MKQIGMDAQGVVVSVYDVDLLQPDAIEVSDEVYNIARASLGRVKWVDDEIVAFEGETIPPYGDPSAPAPRSVAMWRARTIMKVTPWGDGTLFQAVQTAIAGLDDPLHKASAEEALDRGSDFDRDGMFVPLLAAAVGLSDEQLDAMMEQAAGLPA